MNETELEKFIEQKARARWEEKAMPYLLSSVAEDLVKEGKDYKQALGEVRLLTAVRKMAETADFEVVEHPTQRAKIGIVPKGLGFTFPSEDSAPSGIESSKAEGEARLVQFVKSLSHLTEQQLDAMVIPAKVFVEFLVKK
jgi:hypothetical protein